MTCSADYRPTASAPLRVRPPQVVPVAAEALAAILRALDQRGHRTWSGDTLCAAARDVLEADGAALCLAAEADHTVIGVDPASVVQLADLPSGDGEGPCLDAVSSGRMVVGDLVGGAVATWPVFARRATSLGYRTSCSWPLQLGAIRLGALTVFREDAEPPDAEADSRGFSFALAATELVLLTNDPSSPTSIAAILDGSIERRAVVHQATGMVSVQLDVGLADALSVLRARAWAESRSITELARAIVSRRRRLA
jgi:hypothetical protein